MLMTEYVCVHETEQQWHHLHHRLPLECSNAGGKLGPRGSWLSEQCHTNFKPLQSIFLLKYNFGNTLSYFVRVGILCFTFYI